MKKILLIGDFKLNCGPANVNRELINNSNGVIKYIIFENKYIKFLETLIKILLNNVIIISGYSTKSLFYTKLANLFNKKVIYIMHGCIKYENEINKLKLNKKYIERELIFLKNVNLILCVSEHYSKWVKNYYPEISNKIDFLNNGIPNIKSYNITNKKKNNNVYKISLIGGNRNIKNNLIVCKAIEQLIDEGLNIEVKLFGRNYEDNEEINLANVKYEGMVSKEVLNKELQESNLYICNSHVEPFGLSVIDALFAGCDIVINKNVGSSSIFDIEEKYIIQNENDILEIKEKINYTLKNPNNKKIIKTIKDGCDFENASKKLIELCEKI